MTFDPSEAIMDDLADVWPPEDPGQWPTEPQFEPPAEDETSRYRFQSGGSFILDQSEIPVAWWGLGDEILGAEGESLLIAGPQGTGKTTLAQQLALGLAGIPEFSELLGYPITPTAGRVLYLAMDRPRQAARSFRRMVGESMRDELNERLVVWPGPPPVDLAQHPGTLLGMARDAGATAVVVDSLKDAFIGLADDEAAAAWNRARQLLLAEGIDLAELHHIRKNNQGATEAPNVDSIYGSTWVTAGCGSVLLLSGAPGDPIVGLRHVKQPAELVGPFKILHDHDAGRTSIWHAADLVTLAGSTGGLSALDAARALCDTETPTPANKEQARRRLEALVRAGLLVVVDEGDKTASSPRLWGAK